MHIFLNCCCQHPLRFLAHISPNYHYFFMTLLFTWKWKKVLLLHQWYHPPDSLIPANVCNAIIVLMTLIIIVIQIIIMIIILYFTYSYVFITLSNQFLRLFYCNHSIIYVIYVIIVIIYFNLTYKPFDLFTIIFPFL